MWWTPPFTVMPPGPAPSDEVQARRELREKGGVEIKARAGIPGARRIQHGRRKYVGFL